LAYRIKRDNYRNNFQAAVAVLKQNATDQSTISANPGTAFGLGFPDNVFHDPLFGYNTKRRWDYIIIDPETAYSIDRSRDREPQSRLVYDYTMRLLSEEYQQIYNHGSYTIFARKSLDHSPALSLK
jgi:hypothetical protein